MATTQGQILTEFSGGIARLSNLVLLLEPNQEASVRASALNNINEPDDCEIAVIEMGVENVALWPSRIAGGPRLGNQNLRLKHPVGSTMFESLRASAPDEKRRDASFWSVLFPYISLR